MTGSRWQANRLLLVILAPLALLTLVAMIWMWPSGSREGIALNNPYSGAPGATFESGRIQRVLHEGCVQAGNQGSQVQADTECVFAFTEPDKGGTPVKVIINPDVAKSHGVKAGDNITYVDLSASPGVASSPAAPRYIFVDFVRTVPVLLLAMLYAVVVVTVARWRGLRALMGLVGAFAVLAAFILPGLAEGKPPVLLALVGSTVIMMGMLYFAHGFSARTSTALLGTVFGLGIIALLAAWSTDAANLWGKAGFEASTLSSISSNISISAIILCGLIISGLGVLNDVTIAQSSAVWELYELAPETTAHDLFTSAMRIGRDHIASTVYTIAFAYAGAALPVLIIVMLYGRPLGEVLTSAETSEEVVRTLVGSVGLVLAIPVTTLIAVLVVKAEGARTRPGRPTSSGITVPRDRPPFWPDSAL
ncbi:YibE/F family protein [Pseudarthrobacter sp. CC12]|uniref:YibE/F family protein n=1 Tax=unclassified Pseudarthrobacter TaxID=2647000 RepID=UPI001F0C5804|nr:MULTISPECIES: YibE/F family protein [unclassified Pseudarthrobacter]